MKTSSSSRSRGVTLVETILSTGVLAAAAPLALAAMIRAGDSAGLARMDSRSPAIIDACLAEIDLALRASSDHLPALQPGSSFGTGTPLCLIFDRSGTLLGGGAAETYEHGALPDGDRTPVYLAAFSGERSADDAFGAPMISITLGIEHPAAAGRTKRRRTEFFTKVP